MSAEPYSASLINQLPQYNSAQLPQGYYRSRLYIAPYESNSLVSAAGPLFSLMERLCISQNLPAIQSIRANIDHELKAFYSKASAADYSKELKSIAYYLLSATLDEILGKNYLRLYGSSPEFNAFTPLTHDGSMPQSRFFEIIAYIKDRTHQYLDLIELSYFCLITGFEGEHHMQADGRQHLDNLIEELYLLIQKNRVNKPCKLYQEKAIIETPKSNHKPLLIAISLTLGLFISSLWFSHAFIENKAKHLLQWHAHSLILDN